MTPDPPAAGPHPAARPRPARRPARKSLVVWVRRAHLYLGLFLLPWVVLYGATAFLFNHPTALNHDPAAVLFTRAAFAGTPLETPPTPTEQAAAVVARLNELHKPAAPVTLAGEARYARDFATVTSRSDGETVTMFLDLRNGGGSARAAPTLERPVPRRAPFAVGAVDPGPPRPVAAVRLDDGITGRVRAAAPALFERAGFAPGEVTVTAVPDLVFPVESAGEAWTATYSPLAGTVAGTPGGPKPEAGLGWRRFVLRLHTSHGYPAEANGRWFWALVVDAMAATMLFWALSGLVMWWQIRAARRAGAVVLAASAAAAGALGVGMYAVLAG